MFGVFLHYTGDPGIAQTQILYVSEDEAGGRDLFEMNNFLIVLAIGRIRDGTPIRRPGRHEV